MENTLSPGKPGDRSSWQLLLAHLKQGLRQPDTLMIPMGAAVLLPMLGASGLWDPWETHYAEVARRMVEDNDWITPRWRNELFFSKPILNFWLMAGSFKIFGLSAFAARLPFALVGIFGIWFSYRFVARLTDSRRGMAAAFVLATTPFYFFIARQAITDITFGVFVLGMLGCFAVVAMERTPPLRWVLGIYIFGALAALAKTPVGLAIPFVVALCFLLLTGRWEVLRRLKLHLGIPLFFLVATPWYLTVQFLHGRKFSDEFFMHHNLQRAFTGVHGERGTFEYFVQQFAYGFFPWLALLPLTLGRILGKIREKGFLSKTPPAETTREQTADRLEFFLLLWFGVTFATFTLIVTKFHHYIFPAVLPLSLLVGLTLASEERPGWRLLGPLGALLLVMVVNDLISSDRHLALLYTYAYERQTPADIYPRWILFALSAGWVGLLLLGRWFFDRRILIGLAGVLAAASSGLLAWYYQPVLGHSMSQEGLFETYKTLVPSNSIQPAAPKEKTVRASEPPAKLYQYQMNWRGEVFYSHDTIQKVSDTKAVQDLWIGPDRIFLIAVRDSLGALDRAVRQATGQHAFVLPGSNLRYVLLSNRIDPGMEDLNPLAKNVLVQPPVMGHPQRAEFAEGVAFLGYDLSPEHPDTGDTLDLTLYFECLKKLEKSWQIFIHIDGQGREFHRINGDHFPAEGIYTTDQWLPGDIVKDQVKLKVPIEFTATEYTIYLGFYIGDDRMRVLPGFPQDGANRVRAGTFRIE